uniref:Uncharacterized protein n=1 Tax=Timema cristinae TaxID=61476 RepID=A0A7R9H675_TIMCR|nr:unnamed protein product [Timema cristinae]
MKAVFRKGGINTETDHIDGITSSRVLPSLHDHSNTSTTTMKAVFAFLALFAIFAIAFAQESAPKESLKGSEAVYLASPYGYAGYAGYWCLPLRRLRCWLQRLLRPLLPLKAYVN